MVGHVSKFSLKGQPILMANCLLCAGDSLFEAFFNNLSKNSGSNFMKLFFKLSAKSDKYIISH